jgi:hypothetical protein
MAVGIQKLPAKNAGLFFKFAVPGRQNENAIGKMTGFFRPAWLRN